MDDNLINKAVFMEGRNKFLYSQEERKQNRDMIGEKFK